MLSQGQFSGTRDKWIQENRLLVLCKPVMPSAPLYQARIGHHLANGHDGAVPGPTTGRFKEISYRKTHDWNFSELVRGGKKIPEEIKLNFRLT